MTLKMDKFQKGDDFLQHPDATHMTFGIHCQDWAQQIEVHGDEKLRDLVLRLLEQEELRQKKRYNLIPRDAPYKYEEWT